MSKELAVIYMAAVVLFGLVCIGAAGSIAQNAAKREALAYEKGYNAALKTVENNVAGTCTAWWFGKEKGDIQERRKQIQKAFCKG